MLVANDIERIRKQYKSKYFVKTNLKKEAYKIESIRAGIRRHKKKVGGVEISNLIDRLCKIHNTCRRVAIFALSKRKTKFYHKRIKEKLNKTFM